MFPGPRAGIGLCWGSKSSPCAACCRLRNSARMEKDTEALQPTVTVELVERVAKRVENGIPLAVALFGEGVTVAVYEQHLRDNPELAAIEETAMRKFMEFAVKKMLEEEKPAASLRWLLEHCHPNLLAQPSAANPAAEPQTQTIAGLPNNILERMRDYARNADEH